MSCQGTAIDPVRLGGCEAGDNAFKPSSMVPPGAHRGLSGPAVLKRPPGACGAW
jgi:hypothetical protein